MGVIGSGPGGYVAAIKAAQEGLKVFCVDKREVPGGTCLNVGCIPSKALLKSAKHYYEVRKKFSNHGIVVENVRLDWKKMLQRKDKVVSDTSGGIEYLFKKNKVDFFGGEASFKDAHTLSIKNKKGEEKTFSAKNMIVATGSEPIELPFMPFDHKKIIASKDALCLKKIPKHMVLVGGGVIGVELGSVYAKLGSKVSVIETCDRLIPSMDEDLSKELQKSFLDLDWVYYLSSKVLSAEVKGDNVFVKLENKKKEIKTIEADVVLVCVGRKPYTKGLGLEKIGVDLDDRGCIVRDENFKTTVKHIYALGDVTEGVMLAHKASEEGVVCVENIMGVKTQLNYKAIPSVVYTSPEVASVGATEKELMVQGLVYNVGRFPFSASGKARASDETVGFVKVLTSKKTDEVLGIHIIGPRASDIIGSAVMSIEYRSTAEDIAMMPHAHPSYLEALKEAALFASTNKGIHF